MLIYGAVADPAPGVNEPHYIGKAKHFWAPAWCPGDLLYESSNAHWMFYFTVGYWAKWLTLPQLAWAGRLVGYGATRHWLAANACGFGTARLAGVVVAARVSDAGELGESVRRMDRRRHRGESFFVWIPAARVRRLAGGPVVSRGVLRRAGGRFSSDRRGLGRARGAAHGSGAANSQASGEVGLGGGRDNRPGGVAGVDSGCWRCCSRKIRRPSAGPRRCCRCFIA